MTSKSHPSFLELDRLAVTGPDGARDRDHLAGCEACGSHVASVRAGSDFPISTVRIPARKSMRRSWAIAAVAAAVAAGGAVAVVRHETKREVARSGDFVTAKGGAVVLLYVKRDAHVFVWTSGRSVKPGDRLRLEIAAGGYSHVTVFARAAGAPSEKPVQRLYETALDSHGGSLLPVAWQVDDALGDETLVVVLSNASVRDDDVSSLQEGVGSNPDVWVQRFVLPKSLDGGVP